MIHDWPSFGVFCISFLGGLYAIVKIIVTSISNSQRVKELEKDNEYLRNRNDTLTDAIRNLK